MDTKPCPFCASPKTRIDEWSVALHTEYAGACEHCGATGPYDLGVSGAIEMWNMRRTEFPNTMERNADEQSG